MCVRGCVVLRCRGYIVLTCLVLCVVLWCVVSSCIAFSCFVLSSLSLCLVYIVHSLLRSIVRPFVISFVCLFVRVFFRSFVGVLVLSCVRSFVGRSFYRSVVRLFIRSSFVERSFDRSGSSEACLCSNGSYPRSIVSAIHHFLDPSFLDPSFPQFLAHSIPRSLVSSIPKSLRSVSSKTRWIPRPILFPLVPSGSRRFPLVPCYLNALLIARIILFPHKKATRLIDFSTYWPTQ
jgi:hypothetical protein